MSAIVNRPVPSPTTDPHAPPAQPGEEAGAIRSYERDGVVVLRPSGRLDRDGVEEVQCEVRSLAGRDVVIDLTDSILTDPNALADLADDGGEPALCFVSHRPTCRLLLARTGLTSRYAVFHHVADALQARALDGAGYGSGWRRVR